jgi:hypothetical protein
MKAKYCPVSRIDRRSIIRVSPETVEESRSDAGAKQVNASLP